MIDVWSMALGLLAGLAGMLLEGYCFLIRMKDQEEMHDSQLFRRDEWIRYLEKENSRLKKEIKGYGR